MSVRRHSEIKLKVPWGHIAAKTWGSEKNTRVLMVHGILDNAGSFNRLLQQLPENFYYVCIDLPGHGLSSNFPSGIILSYFSYALTIRYVLDELKWKETIYIGHSFGAHLGFFFSLIYPRRIRQIILIDGLASEPILNHKLIPTLKAEQDFIVHGVKQIKTHLYTRDEVIYGLKNLRISSLNTEAAEAIFQRNVTKIDEDKYFYNRDIRLKMRISPLFNLEQILYLLTEVKIKTLIILVTNTIPTLMKHRSEYRSVLKNYNCVSIIDVEGNHDVHNNYPERVSGHISAFLNHNLSKL